MGQRTDSQEFEAPPLLLTAMQLFGLAHDTETVAYPGPGNTLTGFDQ
jgi:hypothetical protein